MVAILHNLETPVQWILFNQQSKDKKSGLETQIIMIQTYSAICKSHDIIVILHSHMKDHYDEKTN